MDALKRFIIPLMGLKSGLHPYEFEVGKKFFSYFEESPLKEGSFKVYLTIDKRPEMLVLDFDFEGAIATSCDRCLANIQLPVKENHQLLVKFSEEYKEGAEVVYLPRDTAELNVAPYIYENIILSLPLIKTYDCDQEKHPPCDFKMLDFLQENTTAAASEENDGKSIWSDLKKNFKGPLKK